MAARTPRETEITLESLHPRTFDKDSPVTAYWLTRCDGFRVVGLRGELVVEGTVYEHDPLKPHALRVRRGTETGLIPLASVEGVCPTRRILYARRRPSVRSRAAAGVSAGSRRAGRSTVRAAARSWGYAAARVGAGARGSAAAARRQWPAARRGAYLVGRGALLLAVMAGRLVVWSALAAGLVLHAALVAARRAAPLAGRLAVAGKQGVQRTVTPRGHVVRADGELQTIELQPGERPL